MSQIKKVAVIGSGVMGAGIAAQIANSGTDVLLLDIVPQGDGDRSRLAKGAIEKMLKTDPAPLMLPSFVNRITPGNLQDDLHKISEVDWIIEVVLERLDVKQELYRKLQMHRKSGSIVSSNTSTLPLHTLVEGMPDEFKKDFLISHFFNPPRYMKLLELVTSKDTRYEAKEIIRRFCDINLGKGVVQCKDTPGFIANRIGIYWLAAALKHAIDMKIPVEVADAVMGRPMGIPKTGVFGLMDLIGIDLLPLIAKSFAQTLPNTDDFFRVYKEHEIITKMITDGYTGRKGKGGFTRLTKEGDKKIFESLDLATGQYRPQQKDVKIAGVETTKSGLRELLTNDNPASQYAYAVMRDTLTYTASLVPEIADSVDAVDEAMRLGYNWKYGPFELIDRIGTSTQTGSSWLASKLAEEGKEVPELLKSGKNFYTSENGKKSILQLNGGYQNIAVDSGAFMLADIKPGKKPLAKSPSAALWDIGDGVVCVEFTSKMNTFDPFIFDVLEKALQIVPESGYKGIVIANDSDNFSAGANIGLALFTANVGAWRHLDEFITRGQRIFMGLKYAPFPVISAPTGLALGGGCEVLLASDAVQAHAELYSGLVEVGIGVIPGWGGCKELLFRFIDGEQKRRLTISEKGGMLALAAAHTLKSQAGLNNLLSTNKLWNIMPVIERAFKQIGMAAVSKSAAEAKEMGILNEKSRITMNRKRLLADARNLCISMSEKYAPPVRRPIYLPGATALAALDMALQGLYKSGKATKHDMVVSAAVARVLSGGDTDLNKALSEEDILKLEAKEFSALVRHPDTLARIETMLNTGKPLRN